MLKADGVNTSFGLKSKADGALSFNFKKTICYLLSCRNVNRGSVWTLQLFLKL